MRMLHSLQHLKLIVHHLLISLDILLKDYLHRDLEHCQKLTHQYYSSIVGINTPFQWVHLLHGLCHMFLLPASFRSGI